MDTYDRKKSLITTVGEFNQCCRFDWRRTYIPLLPTIKGTIGVMPFFCMQD